MKLVIKQDFAYFHRGHDRAEYKAGDVIDTDWVPGTGMTIHVNGKSAGEPFREPEFFAALMRIWLGTKPADWKLKDALLGKAEGAAS